MVLLTISNILFLSAIVNSSNVSTCLLGETTKNQGIGSSQSYDKINKLSSYAVPQGKTSSPFAYAQPGYPINFIFSFT